MSYQPGDRVILISNHAGVPAGSVGTVQSGGPITAVVDFDVASHPVVVPNSLLRPASKSHGMVRQSTFSAVRGESGPEDRLFWHTPTTVCPGVATDANFVPVIATADTLTLLFERVEVSLGLSPSGCWIGSLDFPITGPTGALSVDVRGFVSQPAGARATIIVDVGGTTRPIVFEGETSKDFTETFGAEMSSSTTQTITVVLLAQRPLGSDSSMLVIDGIDILRNKEK